MHDVHFVNYDPTLSKLDDKAGYALGQSDPIRISFPAPPFGPNMVLAPLKTR